MTDQTLNTDQKWLTNIKKMIRNDWPDNKFWLELLTSNKYWPEIIDQTINIDQKWLTK